MPGSEQILLDILEHDWKEAQDDRQDLCQKLNSLQNELQWAEELRDKVEHPSLSPAPHTKQGLEKRGGRGLGSHSSHFQEG